MAEDNNAPPPDAPPPPDPSAPPAPPPDPAAPPPPAPTGLLDGQVTRPPAPPPDPSAPPPADAPAKLVFKERPAWLPENFHDKTTGEVKIEALAKSQSDLRAQLSKGANKPPAKADDYKLEFAPEVAESVKRLFVDGDPAKDPMMKSVRDAAHKHGLSQAQFQSFLGDVLPLLESNQPPAFDAAAEMRALDPNPEKAKQIVQFVINKGQQLRDMGVLTDEMAAEYEIMAGTATGLKTMLALFEYMGEQSIDASLTHGAANSATQGQLDAEMAALMKEPDSPAREQKYTALMQKFEKLYGNAPAGRSAARG